MIVAYFEDGSNLVTLAMNGWADSEPSWWLNLKEQPDAPVDLVQESRAVRARASVGEDRMRLSASCRAIDQQLGAFAAMRASETAVVVLEPRFKPT